MGLLAKHFLGAARTVAKNSVMHPRVGCCLHSKGVVSFGHNQPKTHPLQAMWARRTGRTARIFLHAEIAALLSHLKNNGDIAIESAYIVRLGKGGEYRPSFPCPVCYAALLHAGVKEIIYFDKSGTFSKFCCLSKSSQVLGD